MSRPHLPGFYWDESKNRYFPAVDRSKQPQSWQGSCSSRATKEKDATNVEEANDIEAVQPAKRRKLDYNSNLSAFNSPISLTYAAQSRHKHHLFTQHISAYSQGQLVYSGDDPCSALDVLDVSHDGAVTLSTGNTRGWLQTCQINSGGYACNSSRELYLASEVTALCRSDALRLAVTFGPSCKIAVEKVSQEEDLWVILSLPNKCHDVRVADLDRKSLVLGAAKQGILFSDIERNWDFDVLPTESDVLAICQKDNLVYAGSRNGSIKAFDRRVNVQQKGQELLRDKFKKDTRSITHLSVVNEWQMLVSTIRGNLALFDLRFARKDVPILQLDGHVNSYRTKLGIAVSPDQSIVFAAGQDNRIRAWSLLSGELISSSATKPTELSATLNLLEHEFADPVMALRIEDGRTSGLTLWAASGSDVYRFALGYRLEPGRDNRY